MMLNWQPINQIARLNAFSLGLFVAACATTPSVELGSLAEIKRTQFMPLYQQCMKTRAPLKATRTSVEMLNHVAVTCMRAAKDAVR